MSEDTVELFRRENLGPARATVTLERRRWLPSGSFRYVLQESWTPTAGTVGSVSNTDVFDEGEPAMAAARMLADDWSRSSARADMLSPGGRLRELQHKPLIRGDGHVFIVEDELVEELLAEQERDRPARN